MHLADGVLSVPVVIASSAVAVGGVSLGLRHLPPERVPTAALCAAVFFVASLIHLPLGPASVHLMMSGLAGLLLGWAAFPAIFVCLLLQALLFGFGGVLTLGSNTAMMALPAVLLALPCRRWLPPMLAGAIVGGGSILLSALVCAGLLVASGQAFALVAQGVVWAHLPVAAVEAAVTAAAAQAVARMRPWRG